MEIISYIQKTNTPIYMHKILLFITISLVATVDFFGQHNLSISEYKELYNKAKQLEGQPPSDQTTFDSWKTDEPHFIFKSFTQESAKECLVIYPYSVGFRRKYNALFLLKKNANNEWESSGWKHSGGTEIKLVDLNRDGIYEIIVELSNYGQGSLELEYTLLSLLNHEEKVLYENLSTNNVDSYRGLDKTIGNKLIEEIEVSYSLEKDGSIKVLEKSKIGSVAYPDEENVEDRLKYEMKEKVIRIKIE